MTASICAFAQMRDSTAIDVPEPLPAQPAVKAEKKTSKGLLFFYRSGERIDRFLLNGLDTNFIALPEHSWRLAYTNAMIGVNSIFASHSSQNFTLSLVNKTTPSVDLGFYAGYRGFGFGYSWDAIHAYAQRLSFSLGSKSLGLDFSIQTSTNIQTTIDANNVISQDLGRGHIIITNASLNLWYALNSAHYSHQAAVKQSYIQKKTAGSLLLHLSYMSSQVSIRDTLRLDGTNQPVLSLLMSNTTAIQTRQVAIGIGYGINYTPNKGKVILHASAAAMLVTYSINHISFFVPDSIVTELPGEPMYTMPSATPVHITGNMRAAVSWEINKWVHLNAYATVEHMRFRSTVTMHENSLSLSNWNWKVQVAVGVRFGAGKDRVQRALEAGNANDNLGSIRAPRPNKLPKWINEFFFSPRF